MSNQEIDQQKQSIKKKYPLSILQINILPNNLFPKLQKNEVINYVASTLDQQLQNDKSNDFVYQLSDENRYASNLDGYIKRVEKKRVQPSFLHKIKKRIANSLNTKQTRTNPDNSFINTYLKRIQHKYLLEHRVQFQMENQQLLIFIQNNHSQIDHLKKPVNDDNENQSDSDSLISLSKTEQIKLKLQLDPQQQQFHTKQSNGYLRTKLYLEEMELQSFYKQALVDKLHSIKTGRIEEKNNEEEKLNYPKISKQVLTPLKIEKTGEKKQQNIFLEIGQSNLRIPGIIATTEFKNKQSLEKAQDVFAFRRNYKQNRTRINSFRNEEIKNSNHYKEEFERLKAFSSMDYDFEDGISIQIKNNQIKFRHISPSTLVDNKEKLKEIQQQQIKQFYEILMEKKQKRYQGQLQKKLIIDELIRKQQQEKLEKIKQQELEQRLKQLQEQKERIKMIEIQRRRKMEELKKNLLKKKKGLLLEQQIQKLQQNPQEEQVQITEQNNQVNIQELYERQFFLRVKPQHIQKHLQLIKKIKDKVASISTDRASQYDAKLFESMRKKQIRILQKTKDSLSVEVKAKLQEEMVSILKQVNFKN